MKKFILLFVISLFISCVDKDNYFMKHEKDWNMTKVESITVNKYSQVLLYKDSTLKILTEGIGTLYFDVPLSYDGLFIVQNGQIAKKSKQKRLINNKFEITDSIKSYASIRGWISDEYLYLYNYTTINVEDYSNEYKSIFKAVIFNYFPNGRQYNNINTIKKIGYYNESSYSITTGGMILVSPVYKNDGGYHEVSEADLYYYYYKGDLTVKQLEKLPKYRLCQLSDVYKNNDNDHIAKSKSYPLIYWDNGGSYEFPEGYKIGFMYMSKTNTDNREKQGELYGDGRLNTHINKFGRFKTSKLASTDPRMAWITVNEKMFLCVETGTDSDFNDLILEIEGDIEPITINQLDYQEYTFCFEDQNYGDYDLNDVVLKGKRINETTVEWTLLACGALDELYIHNINGNIINENNEVHKIFGKSGFINTLDRNDTPYITDVVKVDKNYTFSTNPPFIYDKTTNTYIHISKRGEDPHALMIPTDFLWPLEKVSVKDFYPKFNSWGNNLIEDSDWYKR